MKEIILTQGKVTQVSDHRYEELNKYLWYAIKARNTFYAGRNVMGPNGTRIVIKMHRQILGLSDPKIQGDHKDLNGLNNQDSNLRIATHSQNMHNRGKSKNNTSNYKGVSWRKSCKRWRAQITLGNKKIYLGLFPSPELAAQAYDEAAIQQFGDFARINAILLPKQ